MKQQNTRQSNWSRSSTVGDVGVLRERGVVAVLAEGVVAILT